MIVKGYGIENLDGKQKCLHGYLNEYGINLSYKDNTDIFKSSLKPSNCVKKTENTKKR